MIYAQAQVLLVVAMLLWAYAAGAACKLVYFWAYQSGDQTVIRRTRRVVYTAFPWGVSAWFWAMCSFSSQQWVEYDLVPAGTWAGILVVCYWVLLAARLRSEDGQKQQRILGKMVDKADEAKE